MDILVKGATLDRLVDEALATARAENIDEVKITTSMSHDKRLVVENGIFTLANSSESQGVGLLVHHQHRKGSASLNDVSLETLRHALHQAKTLASYSIPDENLWLPGVDLAPKAKPISGIFDDAVSKLTLKELKEVMREVTAELIQDKRMMLDRFEMEIETSRSGLANSHGVRQQEAQTAISWSFSGMAREDEDVSGMDYDGGFSYAVVGFPEKLLQEARIFRDKILQSLNPRSCPSYKGVVVFSPRAFEEMVMETIQFHASGWQVMDGKSRWHDRVGEKVAHSLFSLRDNPHDVTLHGTTAYDNDGLPTQPRSVIEQGVLNLHLVDCYSARRLKRKPLGTAGAPFNIEVSPGTHTEQELLSLAPNVLWVDRFSGNLDALTGDFSGVAKGSRFYKNGQDQGSVTETMIAGNVFDMLKNIVGLSKDVKSVGGQSFWPSAAMDGISVTS